MNTTLLTSTNTCWTTKNIKMMAAVICLTAVFVFTNVLVFAQASETIQSATQTKMDAKKVEHVQVVKTTQKLPVAKAKVTTTAKAMETTTAKEVVKEETPTIVVKRTLTSGTATNLSGAREPIEIVAVKEEKVAKNTVPVVEEISVSNSKLPYYNYKGITNPKEARKAWANDNPQEANKYLQSKPAESLKSKSSK